MTIVTRCRFPSQVLIAEIATILGQSLTSASNSEKTIG